MEHNSTLASRAETALPFSGDVHGGVGAVSMNVNSRRLSSQRLVAAEIYQKSND
jgi:hypothetical protein